MPSLFKRHAHLVIAMLTLCLLVGCSTDSTGPTKAAAQVEAEEEMDKWVSGQKSKTTTFKARIGTYEPPISYKVRSVVPTEPYIPTDVLVEHPGLKQDGIPAFQVVVDIDFRSQAQTSITKVVRYNLTWVEEIGEWTVEEEL